MSDTERTHKTRILRVRQRRRRSKPSEDEDEAQTHHRSSGAVVRHPAGRGNIPACRHSENLIKQT